MKKPSEIEVVVEKNITPFLIVLVIAVSAFLAGSYYQPKSGTSKTSQAVSGNATDVSSDQSRSSNASASTSDYNAPASSTTTTSTNESSSASATTQPESSSSSSGKTTIPGSVNINTADQTTLMTLPGVGLATAKAIIDYRTQHGLFKTIDELDNVKRIGPATINKFRLYVTI